MYHADRNAKKQQEKRIRARTAGILLSGAALSLVIYLWSEKRGIDPLAEFERSRKFAHELERMGGKAALAANSFNSWFAALWQGETLAWSTAAITVLVAAFYYLVATALERERVWQAKRVSSKP